MPGGAPGGGGGFHPGGGGGIPDIVLEDRAPGVQRKVEEDALMARSDAPLQVFVGRVHSLETILLRAETMLTYCPGSLRHEYSTAQQRWSSRDMKMHRKVMVLA